MLIRYPLLLSIALSAFILSPRSALGYSPRDNFELYSAEPFVVDLLPDRRPETAYAVGDTRPLELKATPGETESALLIIRASKHIRKAEITPSTMKAEHADLSIEKVRVRIIRLLPVDAGRKSVLFLRYPALYPTGRVLLPDVLVSDAPTFERMAHNWSKGQRLEDEADTTAATTSAIPKGTFRYLLLTVTVPTDATPGSYLGTVTVRAEGQSASVPVRLCVYPFTLGAPEKVLGVSCEFATPGTALFEPSLKLLSELGMTFTRIRNVTALKDADKYFETLRKYGIKTLSQNQPPRKKEELSKISTRFRPVFLRHRRTTTKSQPTRS